MSNPSPATLADFLVSLEDNGHSESVKALVGLRYVAEAISSFLNEQHTCLTSQLCLMFKRPIGERLQLPVRLSESEVVHIDVFRDGKFSLMITTPYDDAITLQVFMNGTHKIYMHGVTFNTCQVNTTSVKGVN